MRRLRIVACFLICVLSSSAQTSVRTDPRASALIQQSLFAMTLGTPVSDVLLNANITSNLDPEGTSGTATFTAKGFNQGRVDLDLGSSARTEIRTNGARGTWEVNSENLSSMAAHNCRTDAVWFFPALSSLSQISNPSFVFTYVGQQEHDSVNTQHIRVYQIFTGEDSALLEKLSVEDFYLDAETGLPVAVAFKIHPDSDLLTNLAAEVRFGNYQKVSGVLVPFSIQRVVNGAVVLDAKVTNAIVNSGISDAEFNVQ